LLTRPLAAREFGWSRQHFHELSHHPDFPEPVARAGKIELWTRDSLVAWRDTYTRRTRIDNLRTRIAQPKPGDPVVFTPGDRSSLDMLFTPGGGTGLGVLTDPEGTGFSDHVVRAGDPGTYWGPHPSLPRWHMCSVCVDGETLYVPLTRNHFYIRED
jgi:hypothetical protein